MAWRRGNCSDSISPRDHAWSWGRRDGGTHPPAPEGGGTGLVALGAGVGGMHVSPIPSSVGISRRSRPLPAAPDPTSLSSLRRAFPAPAVTNGHRLGDAKGHEFSLSRSCGSEPRHGRHGPKSHVGSAGSAGSGGTSPASRGAATAPGSRPFPHPQSQHPRPFVLITAREGPCPPQGPPG